MKRTYREPRLTVYGTVAKLTASIKQAVPPSDGNYVGTQPLNGSCFCTDGNGS